MIKLTKLVSLPSQTEYVYVNAGSVLYVQKDRAVVSVDGVARDDVSCTTVVFVGHRIQVSETPEEIAAMISAEESRK